MKHHLTLVTFLSEHEILKHENTVSPAAYNCLEPNWGCHICSLDDKGEQNFTHFLSISSVRFKVSVFVKWERCFCVKKLPKLDPYLFRSFSVVCKRPLRLSISLNRRLPPCPKKKKKNPHRKNSPPSWAEVHNTTTYHHDNVTPNDAPMHLDFCSPLSRYLHRLLASFI